MLKKFITWIILLLLVGLTFSPSLSAETKENTQNDRKYIISFNSFIDIEFNTSVLEEPVEFGIPVSVPIEIKYWTEIPENFLWFLPLTFLKYNI